MSDMHAMHDESPHVRACALIAQLQLAGQVRLVFQKIKKEQRLLFPLQLKSQVSTLDLHER